MENQKNERMLVYADEESEDSNPNSKSQANRNGNNYMAQYEAAHQRRSVQEYDQPPNPTQRPKIQSRGRVQINAAPTSVT